MERTQSTPLWLWATGVVFVAAISAIVVSSLRRPEPPVFSLSSPEIRDRPAGLAGPDTVTLDARSGDAWTRFDLATGRVVTGDDAWDVGVKRHRLMLNGGPGFSGHAGAVRLELPFEDVREVPAEGYAQSIVTPGGDTVHAVLDAWYAYDLFSHLLEPDPVTYALRTADGRFAKLRVLSYYCAGPEPGCMTILYAYQGDGSRRVGALR
ncbi:MAG: HmuY family protein [Gemmatimonadota bacterium]|nr:HmuY family protein [Gemmatimonadota bacterium]MDH3426821.1 HmuY family protein [Gemmatimonadota bacterium]